MDLSAYGRQPAHSSSSTSYNKPPSSTIDSSKIFVGGLSWQTTEETLRYHFEQYGEVVSVEVMRDRHTGDPRGFAFVVFQEDATVELVMSNLPHEINHKVVDVKRAQARGMAPPSIHKDDTEENNQLSGHYGDQDSNSKNNNNNNHDPQGHHGSSGGTKELSPEQLQNKIFVGGLPLHLTQKGLQEFFTQFGTVVDAIIMMDNNQNRSRGFGFVTFENGSGGAQLAMKSQPLYIDNKYVEIKLATPKGDQGHHGNRSNNYNNNTGLRNAKAASMAYQSKGEFAGLAASFGRNGWRAGYGTIAFGSYGWNVKGWEDISQAPEKSGFSFDLLDSSGKRRQDGTGSGNGSGSSSSSSRKRRGKSDQQTREAKRQRQS